MKRMSRIVMLVALVALLIGVLPLSVGQAQDDPAWVTYTTDDGVLTFDIPAAWVVTGDNEYGAGFVSDPAAAGQQEDLGDGYMTGGILSPAYVAERLESGFGYGSSLAPEDDLMDQAESLTSDRVYYARTYLWLKNDTLLVVALNASGSPFEMAWIVRRVGDAETIVVSGYAHHGQLVWFVDDLITLAQSITLNTPDDDANVTPDELPALTETYVTLDEVMAIHTPEGWATHMFSPGTLLFSSSQRALDRMLDRGEINATSMLFMLMTPSVTTALMGDALTPETSPEEVLAFFVALSNAAEDYGAGEAVTVGPYPAARAFMAQRDFQVVTYTVQLAPGQFALFDLMMDADALELHLPRLEAIMASAEVLGE